MLIGMATVTLPPELERFAEQAVAAGRYRDLAELVAVGVDLLRQRETARAAFNASLEVAEAEAERDGYVTLDEIHDEMTGIIAEIRQARG